MSEQIADFEVSSLMPAGEIIQMIKNSLTRNNMSISRDINGKFALSKSGVELEMEVGFCDFIIKKL